MNNVTRQPAQLRALDARTDGAALARLDLSFQKHRVLVVRRHATGFEFVEEMSSPPADGRYEVDWNELLGLGYALVAEQAGRLVGVAALRVTEWNRRGTVAHLYVDRPRRGMGIGSQLVAALELESAERGVRALWVETQNVNVAAIRFYESCGFALCGLDMSLYDPAAVQSETAIYLSKAIEPPHAASVSSDVAAL